jgi:hypothetical protein
VINKKDKFSSKQAIKLLQGKDEIIKLPITQRTQLSEDTFQLSLKLSNISETGLPVGKKSQPNLMSRTSYSNLGKR